MKSKFWIDFVLILITVFVEKTRATNSQIRWQPEKWAKNCDFPGRDMISLKTLDSKCGLTCLYIPGCTHFTWSSDGSDPHYGICYIKSGVVTQNDAIFTSQENVICGIVGQWRDTSSKCFLV